MTPADYESWYATPRGRWIAGREFDLLRRLMHPVSGQRLLDVGCGTGHFSRRFAALGLQVTGADPDPAALAYARTLGGAAYVRADARELPWADGSFDWVTAVTSLCFVEPPQRALVEAWRVARRGVALGLLNRRSVLYRQKQGRGAYAGARWDTPAVVRAWAAGLEPAPHRMRVRSAIFLPGAAPAARWAEASLPARLPWGGFLAVVLDKSNR